MAENVYGSEPTQAVEEDDSDLVNSVEELSDEPPRALKRQVGFKAPMSSLLIQEEGDEEIMAHDRKTCAEFLASLICDEKYTAPRAVPNLAEYFTGFQLDLAQQVAICRTYANYLTQQLRASAAGVEKTPKKKAPIKRLKF